MSGLVEKLIRVQFELKAPKSQENKFGGYKYRNCEDILQAAKPLLSEHGLLLSITDSIVLVGDRIYVEATASITDGTSTHQVKAYAREALTKKGMDESQVTGAASSYARKYALNGLFAIDDTKDADHDSGQAVTISRQQEQALAGAIVAKGYDVISACSTFRVDRLSSIRADQYNDLLQSVSQWPAANQQS